MRGWPEFLIGLFLVLIVFGDVFTTVLVPRATHRGLRFGPVLARTLALPWRRAAALLPSPRLRQDMRGALGPLILVTALITWVAALALGFALMLHAQPQNVSAARYGFGQALFESTLALSTLGMIHSDILGGARFVVAVAGVSGFAVVSLVVAFLLSIQSALHRREVLVGTLAARAGRPPAAATLLARVAGEDDGTLSRFFEAWEVWSAEVMQSHLSYPVLCRFRSLDENNEWLACWGAVLDTAALVEAAAPGRYPRSCRSAAFLLETARRAVHELARLLGVGEQELPIDDDTFGKIEDALRRLDLWDSDAAVRDRFARRRGDYAPRLAAISGRLDIVWDDTLLGGRVPGS